MISPSLRVLLFLLLVLPTAADTLETPRADGTRITYYLDRPASDTFPLVVLLQGSECLKVHHKYGEMVGYLNERGVAVLRVEKPGLNQSTPIGECPTEYLRLNTPQRRVLDLLTVLAEVRQKETGYNGQLALAGGSEGAMVASLTAPLCHDLEALLLFSGGGAGIFGDEVLGSVTGHMRRSGAPEQAIEERRQEMKETIEVIKKNPVWDKEWLSDGKLARTTYLWWASAWDLQMRLPLSKVEAPILAWQGTEDENVPAASGQGLAEQMRQAGRAHFELRTYEGPHVPTQEVLFEGLDWVLNRFTASAGDVSR